jgi:hypothetical protein
MSPLATFTPEDRVWHAQQRELFAQPDITPRRVGEKVFTRTLGRICPHCGRTFYAYQAEGNEQQPYRIEVDPLGGIGMRETCGSPICHEAEDHLQFERRKAWRAERYEAVARVTKAAGNASKAKGKRL